MTGEPSRTPTLQSVTVKCFVRNPDEFPIHAVLRAGWRTKAPHKNKFATVSLIYNINIVLQRGNQGGEVREERQWRISYAMGRLTPI